MAVNISSRVTTLMIGSQDWSAWIDPSSGIQIGTPEYECGNGLLIVRGTINFVFPANFYGLPSSPLFLLNPTQWKRGQLVSIQVGGNYLNCSGQALYILAIPEEPKRDISGKATMSLSIGCRLALEYFPPEPNRDISGVTVGTPLNRGTVISNILNYLGIPNSIGSIPYPIDYALPKTSGNFLQMAGKIADEAGYHLRCNTAGTVIAAPNNLTHGTSDFSYQIGVDEKFWDSIGKVSEQPLERTVVTGVVKDVTASDNSYSSIESKAFGLVFPDANPKGQTAQIPIKRISKKISSTNLVFTEIVSTSEPFGVLFPDATPQFQSSLIFNLIETTKYYLKTGLCYKVDKTTYAPFGVLFPDATPQFQTGLVLKDRTIQVWDKISEGKWNLTTTTYQAYGLAFPDATPQFQTGLALISQKTEIDTSGPPTNFGDIGSNTTTDRQISAIVYAQQLAEDPFRPREKTINLEFANTQAQLTAYGENFNKFLTGRSQGKQFVGAIPVSTDFVPFKQVAVTDPFVGLVYYLKIDSIQYAINQTEAIAAFNGILCGTAPAATPTVVTRPVEIVLSVEPFLIDFSGSITVPDYLPVEPFLIDFSGSIILPNYLEPTSIFLIRS